jgi:hypothetical protein
MKKELIENAWSGEARAAALEARRAGKRVLARSKEPGENLEEADENSRNAFRHSKRAAASDSPEDHLKAAAAHEEAAKTFRAEAEIERRGSEGRFSQRYHNYMIAGHEAAAAAHDKVASLHRAATAKQSTANALVNKPWWREWALGGAIGLFVVLVLVILLVFVLVVCSGISNGLLR